MAYKGLIDASLRQAFNLAKDLAIPAVFTMKASGNFNFATAAAADVSAPPVTAKIILMDGTKQKADSKVVKKQFMVKSKDVPSLKGLDTVAFEGQVWQIGPILKDSGYVLVAEAIRTGV